MVRVAIQAILAVLALALGGHAASAAKRVALVIGDGAYANAPTLANPKNDAEDMAAALKAHTGERIAQTAHAEPGPRSRRFARSAGQSLGGPER